MGKFFASLGRVRFFAGFLRELFQKLAYFILHENHTFRYFFSGYCFSLLKNKDLGWYEKKRGKFLSPPVLTIPFSHLLFLDHQNRA